MLALAVWQPGDTNGLWGGVEGYLLDLRFALRGPLPEPRNVGVILIDDADVARLGAFPPPGRPSPPPCPHRTTRGPSRSRSISCCSTRRPRTKPWPRRSRRRAAVVLAVARDGVPDVDGALAAAVARSGVDVVLDAPPNFVTPPLGPVSTLASSGTLGHVNVAPDPDSALRRLPAALPIAAGNEEVWVPGLALAALRAADPVRFAPMILRGLSSGATLELGETTLRLDRFGSVPLVHYGPAGSIATWPLRSLEGADLEGRIVFIGLSASGAGDRYATPFDAMLPGVEAHATLAANVLEGRHLRRGTSAWLLGGLVAGAAAAATLAATRLSPMRIAITLPVIAGSGAVVLHGAFLAGWWLDAVTVFLAIAASASVGLAAQFARSSRRFANLARYHSPRLLETLADSARPGIDGQSGNAVAVFVDLAGSTALSETVGPEGAAHLLSGFHDKIDRLVENHGGVVDQVIGDGAMITFGLPEPGQGDAAAALALVASLLQEQEASRDAAPAMRIGAHSGTVTSRVLGGNTHRHLTIAGDAVNVASRLQEVARNAGTGVAISDALLQQSGAPHRWIADLGLRDLGLQSIRGRALRIHVWAGFAPTPSGSVSRQPREAVDPPFDQ